MARKRKQTANRFVLKLFFGGILLIVTFAGGYWAGQNNLLYQIPSSQSSNRGYEERIATLEKEIDDLEQKLQEKELSLILLQESRSSQ